MKFRIKKSWMLACGKGNRDTVVEIERVLGTLPNGETRMYEVRMPDGTLWVVSDWRGAVVPPTVKDTMAAIRALGNITVNRRDGEWRVNFRGEDENTAYYTNDADDALGTAKLMQISYDQMLGEDKS